MTYDEFDRLNADFARLNSRLATLNTEADTALSNGDRAAYQKIVDHMIDLENTHLYAGFKLGALARRPTWAS